MSGLSRLSMSVSFQDFQFSEETNILKNDVACAVFLNDNCVEKLYLNKDSIGKLSLSNAEDRIRFIFRSKQTGAIIGCISFLTKAFFSHVDRKFSQWLTLFDCPEDDEFDGELGEDDEEEPRVLLQYEIRNNDCSDGFNTPKMQRLSTQTDTENTNIPVRYNSNTSYSSKTIEQASPIRVPQPFENVDRVSKEEEEEGCCNSNSVIKKEENVSSAAPQFQYSFHHEHHEISKENNSLLEMKETPRLEANGSTHENLEKCSQGEIQKQGDMKCIVGQISELVKALQEKREASGDFKLENEEVERSKYESRDEGKYLLYLEYERNTKLQEIQKLTENRLVQIENAYQDLDMKSKLQIQGLVDKNKAINYENQCLKEKVQELEEKLENVLEKASEQVEAYSEKCSRQLEFAAAEDHRIKNRTLEKLNVGLREELARIKSLCQQEKELNNNLQAQLDIISNQFKQDIKVVREENNMYNEQISQLSSDLIKVKEKCSGMELENHNLVGLKESLESELKIKSRVILSLKTEMQEYQKLTENLRKSLAESRASNEREIAVLKQSLVGLQEKVRSEERMNKDILEKAKEMEKEISCFKARGYEEKIRAQIEELESYEMTNRDLKEVIEQCKCGLLFGNNEETKAQIEVELEREKSVKLEERLETLDLRYQEQMIKLQAVSKENFELKERLDDIEREKEQYCQELEQTKTLREEHKKLWDFLSSLKQHLALNASELVNQVSQVMSQKEVIKTLNEKLHAYDPKIEKPSSYNLKALHSQSDKQAERSVSANKERGNEYNVATKQVLETRRMTQNKYDDEAKEDKEVSESFKVTRHVKENIQAGIERQESIRSESTKYKNTEIDQKLKELMKKTKIPMKFVRIGEGFYVFGSKRVHVRAFEGKLVIRAKDAYLYIDEFIRLYAHQELTKLKTMKGEISYTNLEDEDLPSDVDESQIILDNSLNSHNTLRDDDIITIKEEFPEKRIMEGTARSASISYRTTEASWPLRKELNSSLNPVSRGKEQMKTKSGHVKNSPSLEFSPRFQSHDDDGKRWASNNYYSEQKFMKENNTGKREPFRK